MATQEIPDQKNEFFSVASRFVETPDTEFIELIYPQTGPSGRCVARTILSLLSVIEKMELQKAKDLARWVSIQNYRHSLDIVDLFLELEDRDKFEGNYLLKTLNPNESSIQDLKRLVDDFNFQICILIELYDDISGTTGQHLAHISSMQTDDNGVVGIESRSDRDSVQTKILFELNNGTKFSVFILTK